MELTIDFPLTTGQLCWQAIVGSLRASCGTTSGEEHEEETHITKHTQTQHSKYTFLLTTLPWDRVTHSGYSRALVKRWWDLFCEAGKVRKHMRERCCEAWFCCAEAEQWFFFGMCGFKKRLLVTPHHRLWLWTARPNFASFEWFMWTIFRGKKKWKHAEFNKK